MYCKNCGTWLTDDSRFCRNCGAQVTADSRFRQPYQPGEVQRGTGKKNRKLRISATPQARIFGIPVSGRTALIAICVVIIILLIANRIGG